MSEMPTSLEYARRVFVVMVAFLDSVTVEEVTSDRKRAQECANAGYIVVEYARHAFVKKTEKDAQNS